MRIVIGLGNPGDRYRDTRHNLGFRVVDRLQESMKALPVASDLPAILARAEILRPEEKPEPVWLMKPMTFMNRSGRAVREIRMIPEFAETTGADYLVILDDIYLPFGRLRVRPEGSGGGHNGLESVLAAFESTDVPRLRIGVGPLPADADLKEFVLEEMTGELLDEANRVVDRAAECARSCLEDGVLKAMNLFNG